MIASRLPRRCRLVLVALLALLATGVQAVGRDAGPSEAPEWSDEPPALARLLESGYRAEAGRQPGRRLPVRRRLPG